jgi:hypothetical protein
MPDDGHALSELAEFTHHTVGWKSQPSGGRVPIREALPEPYWRYYCACGTVGGRRASEKAAFEAFLAHKSQRADS